MTRSPYAQRWRLMRRNRPNRPKVVVDQSTADIVYAGRGFAGITLEKPTMSKLLELLKSRKFWAAVAGLILIVVQQFMPDFPLDAEAVTNVIYVVVAFIIGSGLEDSAGPVG
jgi:hypothetical protein